MIQILQGKLKQKREEITIEEQRKNKSKMKNEE